MSLNNLNFYAPFILNEPILKEFPTSKIEEFKNLSKQLPFSSHNIIEFSALKASTIDFSINLLNRDVPFNTSMLQIENQKFLSSWYSNSFLKNHIADVWLEFDSVENEYVENVFITLKNFNHHNTKSVIDFFENLPFNKNKIVIKNLNNLFSKIPKSGIVSHVGIMSNREFCPVRINIKNLEPEFNLTLKKICPNAILDKLNTITSIDKMTLTLDVTDAGVSDKRIGIEYFFNQQHKTYKKQKDFLNNLVRKQMCTTSLRDNALNWIDIIPVTPSKSFFADDYFSHIAISYVWRIINHVKLVITEEDIEAKLYLSYGHKWKRN